jgi:hypothetical protein
MKTVIKQMLLALGKLINVELGFLARRLRLFRRSPGGSRKL